VLAGITGRILARILESSSYEHQYDPSQGSIEDARGS
jgi:hypothetical protein